MAARLIIGETPGTTPPVPDREDVLESFWHVLFWIALKYCDHQMNVMRVVELLGSLFERKYIGPTGQAEGGLAKCDSLKSQSNIRDMKLGSKVLRAILVNTAKVLAIRYPSEEIEDRIPQI